MAGLDNIKSFETGGFSQAEDTADTQETGGLPSTPIAKAIPAKGPYALATPTGGVGYDPSLLAKMEELVKQKEAEQSGLMSSLQDATAWWSGGAAGPGEALARRAEQRDRQQAELFGMKSQLSQAKTAQERAAAMQEANQNIFAPATGAVGAPGAPGVAKGPYDFLTPSAKSEYLRINKFEGPQAANSYLQKIVAKNQELEASANLNPASMDRKPTVIMNPNTKKPEVRDINRFEYEQLKQKGLILDASSYYEAPAGKLPGTMTGTVLGAEAAQPLSVRNNNPGNLKDPKTGELRVFTTPEEGQKALEDDLQGKISGQSPALKQRFGDTGGFVSPAMLAEAWSPSTAAGNTPESTMNYGSYIAAKLGIEPTAKIPSTPEARAAVAQAIKEFESGQGKSSQIAGAPSVQVASTGMPDVANILAQRKASETALTSAGEARGKSGEAMRTAFEADTDPGTLDDSYATSRRIQDIVKKDPTLSGVINQPGVAAAVAGVVQKGIGNFGVADLENAIFKSLPTTTQKSLGERSELISYLAKIELQTAKLIKGQGQITEGEREILQRASSSISDPAELIYKKAKVLERVTKMNEELAKVYGTGEDFTDFRKFKNDPQFIKIHKEFRGDLENILKESPSFARPVAGQKASVSSQTQHPQDIQDIINRNKAK